MHLGLGTVGGMEAQQRPALPALEWVCEGLTDGGPTPSELAAGRNQRKNEADERGEVTELTRHVS